MLAPKQAKTEGKARRNGQYTNKLCDQGADERRLDTEGQAEEIINDSIRALICRGSIARGDSEKKSAG